MNLKESKINNLYNIEKCEQFLSLPKNTLKKYLIELKSRRHSIDKIKLWGGATIERDKYQALMRECGDKIPGYINKFPCGSYYGWNLKKIKEPSWYEKMYNKSTVENKGLRPKIVGDLQFEDGKKLIGD